jgi:hypothetical protein
MIQHKRGLVPALFLISGLLLAPPLMAQDPGDEEMAAMMAAGQPGEHHKHLGFMAGEWNVKASFWMPGSPEAMTSDGTAAFKWVLGGRYMRQDYTSQFMGMPFQGIGTTGYDNVGKQYQSTWTDNMSTTIMSEHGQCDGSGKKFSFTGEMPDPGSGTMLATRTEQVVESQDRFVLTSYAKGPDGKEMKLMELVYTRK